MNGPRRVLQVLAELRRDGVTERAQALVELAGRAATAEVRSEAASADLHRHAADLRAVLAEDEQRLRVGLGTVADLERSAHYRARSRGTLDQLERQADRARRAADEARRAEAQARKSLAVAEGERVAAQAVLRRQSAEALRRSERGAEEAAEDVARARAADERIGRRH